MANVRLISFNAAGGAQVSVLASILCRRAEAIEDGSVAAQGLIYKSEEDGFVGTYQIAAETEPVLLGNPIAWSCGGGRLIGMPAQGSVGFFNRREADVLFKGTSATALTTKIRFAEYE